MAIARCWNCGAGVAGPTCQMCGAAQQANAAPTPPAYAPGGQPAVSQASMSVRSPQSMAGNQYVPGGQYQYPPAGQPGGWQAQPPMPGYAQQGYQQGYPQPGYQPPMPGQAYPGAQPVGPNMTANAGPSAGLVVGALLLPLVGGGIAAIIGALIWAFFLESTKTNYTFLGLGLGLLVGIGVVLGAGGRRNGLLAIIAGVLGLLSFFLALYFRLSLATADFFGEGTNLFALPFGNFFDVLNQYLQDNPINYLYFVLVPLIAAGTALRGRGRRR
jgi:hypothetical protein